MIEPANARAAFTVFAFSATRSSTGPDAAGTGRQHAGHSATFSGMAVAQDTASLFARQSASRWRIGGHRKQSLRDGRIQVTRLMANVG